MTMIRLIVDSFNCVPSFESRDECNANERRRERVRGRVRGRGKRKRLKKMCSQLYGGTERKERKERRERGADKIKREVMRKKSARKEG